MDKPDYLFQNYQYTLIPALLLGMTGVLLAYTIQVSALFWFIWLGVCVLGMMLSLVFRASKAIMRYWVWFLCFMLGGVYFTLFHFEPGSHDISHLVTDNSATVSGTLVDYGTNDNQWVLEAKALVQPHQAVPVTGRVLVKLLYANTVPADPKRPVLQMGETVQITGILKQPPLASFPGDFSYRNYLLQNHITAYLLATHWSVSNSQPANSWLALLRTTADVRQRIIAQFQSALPGYPGQLLASVVLGDHAAGVDNDVKQQFIRSGLVHVLAASGLNVALISVFFLFFGRLLRLPLRVTLVIAMAGVAFYALMTGLPPSVQRAGLMLELAFSLKFINKSFQAVTLLCITGVLLTVMNPMIVGMTGFQLSFMSTFGIMVMVTPLQEKLGFYMTYWLAELLLVPLVAQLWVTPILAYTFNQVPVFSLPANIISMPLVALLTYAGFILGGLSLLVPALTHFLLSWLWAPLMALAAIASFFSHMAFSLWQIYALSFPAAVVWIGVLVLISYYLYFPERLSVKLCAQATLAALLIMILPMSIAKFYESHETNISWIPDGPYAPIRVIVLPHQTAVVNVINLKPWTARILNRYLQKKEVTHIALLNITNPAIKHLDGLLPLSKAIKIDQITCPKGLSTEKLNELITWSELVQKPLIAVDSTYRVSGRAFQALFYHQMPDDTLQRFEFGQTCLVSYQGPGALKDSPLNPLAKGCPMIEDRGRLLMKVNGKPARVELDQFHQVKIANNRLWLQ